MERLTKRDAADWISKHCKPMDDCTAMYCLNRLKDRLSAYEDRGCAPEEVLPKDKADEIALKLMRLADLESLCNYTRLRELAEADKDGRVVVRPCKGLSTKPDDGRQMVLEQAIVHLKSLLRDHDFECEDCKRDHRELLELLVELKERRG